ncbi:MAG: hypothetical protein QE278_12680 [Limnobacter sp.]|nr:hypothetical protein [Limnobacter sp.]
MIAQGIANGQAENVQEPQQLTRAENQIWCASVGFITAVGSLAGAIVTAQSPSGGGITVGLILGTVLSTSFGTAFLTTYLHERHNPQAIPQMQVDDGDAPETSASTPAHAGDPDTLNRQSFRVLSAALNNLTVEHMFSQTPQPANRPNVQPAEHIV